MGTVQYILFLSQFKPVYMRTIYEYLFQDCSKAMFSTVTVNQLKLVIYHISCLYLKSSHRMELEISLLFSEGPATCKYLAPDECSPHAPIVFL
jgi:hypothetical protein